MKFRTEIEVPRHPVYEIDHDSKLLMLGSCFTDNIGQQLSIDGFDVAFNPMGPLYNPFSILNAITLAKSLDSCSPLYAFHDSTWHCLDFASRYSAQDLDDLKQTVNSELEMLSRRINESDTIIITIGTSYVFSMDDHVVGNCHKLPSSKFIRRKLTVDECYSAITQIKSMLSGKTVVFTISPIRHVADTLHGNQVSKATLLAALHCAMEDDPDILYFPSYEIMLDDLRDYRFYQADLKHPSETAIQYIYEVFAGFYFDSRTIEKARVCRRQSKRLAHIPIIRNATESL